MSKLGNKRKGKPTSDGRRIMRTYRLAPESVRILDALTGFFAGRDPVRRVTATETLERALRDFASRQGIF